MDSNKQFRCKFGWMAFRNLTIFAFILDAIVVTVLLSEQKQLSAGGIIAVTVIGIFTVSVLIGFVYRTVQKFKPSKTQIAFEKSNKPQGLICHGNEENVHDNMVEVPIGYPFHENVVLQKCEKKTKGKRMAAFCPSSKSLLKLVDEKGYTTEGYTEEEMV